MTELVLDLLRFYGGLNRSLSFLEIWRLLPNPSNISPRELLGILDSLCQKGTLESENGFWKLTKTSKNVRERRLQDLIQDVKWKKILRSARLFRHIPFLKFVLVSGSMALGNVSETSDFDVLVSVREKRIFTTRYAIHLLFSLFSLRRMTDLHDGNANRFCFNHFVAKSTFEKEPKNFYRYQLYRSLIPIFGNTEKIQTFLNANAWCNPQKGVLLDYRYQRQNSGLFRKLLEKILGGGVGDFIEMRVLKPIAKRRLDRYIAKKNAGGRVVISDKELEFHFDLTNEQTGGKLETRWLTS